MELLGFFNDLGKTVKKFADGGKIYNYRDLPVYIGRYGKRFAVVASDGDAKGHSFSNDYFVDYDAAVSFIEENKMKQLSTEILERDPAMEKSQDMKPIFKIPNDKGKSKPEYMNTDFGRVEIIRIWPQKQNVTVYHAKNNGSSVFWINNEPDSNMLAANGYVITKLEVPKGQTPYSLTTGEIGIK